jgi:hypothetical protein
MYTFDIIGGTSERLTQPFEHNNLTLFGIRLQRLASVPPLGLETRTR